MLQNLCGIEIASSSNWNSLHFGMRITGLYRAPGIVTSNERYTDARNKYIVYQRLNVCVFQNNNAAVAKYKLIISELRKNEIRDHEAEALMYMSLVRGPPQSKHLRL